MKSTARFIAVLDLTKAYDSIVKAFLFQKLQGKVDSNLANQLLIFLLTVRAHVAGDITKTEVIMRKGLTQGGTYSPALFKLYINDLPDEVRNALREINMDIADLYPIRLVADDVVCLTKDERSLQAALVACERWARANKCTWNPTKSQIIDVLRGQGTQEDIVLGTTVLNWAKVIE